ncbi:Nuclear import receptor [Ascosphaera acerosa]|nr:Nuclear import receptor [Ascosphaera acerosa]
MASTPATPPGAPPYTPVLSALATMSKNVPSQEKLQAHEYLEKFQKSPGAWVATHAILQSADVPVEAKLFAATTLKGKIIYDLDQLPPDEVVALRDSILAMLVAFGKSLKPIRTQLCICLASLAIQMLDWKDVLATVSNALGTQNSDLFLEFLKILPEEVTEGRKINVSVRQLRSSLRKQGVALLIMIVEVQEEDLEIRTIELLEDNASQVRDFFISYSQSSLAQIVESPIIEVIMKSFNEDDAEAFEAATDTLCTLYRDTTEVDATLPVIQALYPRIVALRPKIQAAAKEEDSDSLSCLTRVFAEAGEAWVVLIARLPAEFQDLVEAVLECCDVDDSREFMSYTFNFWYELKQYLVKDRYADARQRLSPIYSRLVDIMIKHLRYPTPENGDDSNLFEGNAETEDKFREFRHNIGDVLKDCCEVIGVDACLGKAYDLLRAWAAAYGEQATQGHVPHWQELEAAIFSLRAMGRMVDPEEDTLLPQIIPLIVRMPHHEKTKFQAVMALARYTEWTAHHPETMETQLAYVISGFSDKSIEVVQAAALAFKYLGTDCRKLLGQHIAQIHGFYQSVLDKLKPLSQEEITEGVAAVVSVQPPEKIYDALKAFCDPVMSRIMALADKAKDDQNGQRAVADHVQLISIFMQVVAPYIPPGNEHPCVKYCAEVLPILNTIVMAYTKSVPILERVCRCWRYMVISYRSHFIQLLPALASSLSSGFEACREGCFLWATDAVLREFSGDIEPIPEETSAAVYQFFEQQSVHFLRILNDLPPVQLPDMIEDFFRLVDDAVRFYPQRAILSELAPHILSASLSALTLQAREPLVATLHYLHDLLSYGLDRPVISSFSASSGSTGSAASRNQAELRNAIRQLMATQGNVLVQRILTGMMFTFPADCFLDASTVMMLLFEMIPQEAASWVEGTIQLLPAGSIKPGESEKLMQALRERMVAGDSRRIRNVIQDFTNSYRRRNVAPREGLGRLEASRFTFTR